MLLVALVSLMLVGPTLEGTPAAVVLPATWMCVLAGSVLMVSEKRVSFVLSLVMGIPLLLVLLYDTAMGMPQGDAVLSWIQLLFVGHVAVEMFAMTIRQGTVDFQKLAAAFSVYLLMGIIWAIGYELVEAHLPGSLVGPEGRALERSDYAYFSFVTLTTLGYGDIQPVSSLARMLAVLEASAGVLYVAVLVSRLVASYGDELRRPQRRGAHGDTN